MAAGTQDVVTVVGFTGNLRRPSKTRTLVETVIERIDNRYGTRSIVFDLLDLLPQFGTVFERRGCTGKVADVLEQIESAGALVVGTPVYKASYTGLFKHLIDLVEPERLAGVPVVLTATGGGDGHALMIEHQMRPLFAFFNANTIATGIYAAERDFVDGRVASERLLRRIEAAVQDLSPWLERGRINAPASFKS